MIKIQSGCYLKRLTPEAIKLFGSTEEKIIKNKDVENVLPN